MSEPQMIYLRDGYRCPHCGCKATSIQHRINRGMGGSRDPKRHAPSNLLAFCWLGNAAMEANSQLAREALHFGWKLPPDADPTKEPFYDMADEKWYLVDDDYFRNPCPPPERAAPYPTL